jgi:exodeoxyribonuclease V beta subunit
MEFYLHVDSLATGRINAILAGQPGFVALEEKTVRGHLTGFIDLVCRAHGKFYLIDYKTNFLGEGVAQYSLENLAAAMRAHNYGLQYWLYTVVLHRYLRRSLAGYRYAEHFGGVLYLFVRGMDEERPGSGVFSVLPALSLVEQLDHAIGEADHG